MPLSKNVGKNIEELKAALSAAGKSKSKGK